jgi:tRNA uridine 5-carboxymethylaminomethyl modification enzyme
MNIKAKYDVIVAGGGHAGIEAALAAARMGCETLLVTQDEFAIGRMSCNPAVGGTAKGHLVREVDALGGEIGKIADETAIQYRMLNKSKGAAVWSPRSQNDREEYSKAARRRILNQEKLTLFQGEAKDIRTKDGKISSVILGDGSEIKTQAFILCAGTFLNALMYTGLDKFIGGRYKEPPATGLTENLVKLGLKPEHPHGLIMIQSISARSLFNPAMKSLLLFPIRMKKLISSRSPVTSPQLI